MNQQYFLLQKKWAQAIYTFLDLFFHIIVIPETNSKVLHKIGGAEIPVKQYNHLQFLGETNREASLINIRQAQYSNVQRPIH